MAVQVAWRTSVTRFDQAAERRENRGSQGRGPQDKPNDQDWFVCICSRNDALESRDCEPVASLNSNCGKKQWTFVVAEDCLVDRKIYLWLVVAFC